MRHAELMKLFAKHGFEEKAITRSGVRISYTLHSKVRNAKWQSKKEELPGIVSKAIVKGLQANGYNVPKGTQFQIVSWENRRNFWYNLEQGYLVKILSIHPEDEALALLHS